MRSDIVPGGVFPDYELPDHMGTKRKLSELQGDDPLILTLARYARVIGQFVVGENASGHDIRTHD